MLENKFKTGLVKDLKKRFPGCMVVHLDPNEIQGIPDLLVLYRDRWAALEGKKTGKASHRPNQDYYVAKMNEMSYASFIYPENKEEILDELERSFTTATSRVKIAQEQYDELLKRVGKNNDKTREAYNTLMDEQATLENLQKSQYEDTYSDLFDRYDDESSAAENEYSFWSSKYEKTAKTVGELAPKIDSNMGGRNILAERGVI